MNRPKKINDIILSMRFWNYEHTLLFFKEFVELNCKKVNFVLNDKDIDKVINSMSERDMKSHLIGILQSINEYNEKDFVYPKVYR